MTQRNAGVARFCSRRVSAALTVSLVGLWSGAAGAQPVAPGAADAGATPAPALAPPAPANAEPGPPAPPPLPTGAQAPAAPTARATPDTKPEEAQAKPLTEAELLAVQAETTSVESSELLSIYGFADFTYFVLAVSDDNAWSVLFAPYPSFAIGNLNVYFSSDLGGGFRSLAEVRFSYLPHGAENVSSEGVLTQPNNSVRDYTDFERNEVWGGIVIERAWIEYAISDLFTIRGGQWLTPYGIWNVDHGSPTIIGTHRPFVIGESLFPERQTGIELYGRLFVDATELGYHLTVSNGRGPVDMYRDYDNNKAVGGRLYAQNGSLLGKLGVGASAYRGRYTAVIPGINIDTSGPEPRLNRSFDVTTQYDELSLAADVKWELERFLVQGEIVMNEAAFTANKRPRQLALQGDTGVTPDYRRWGVYGLAGYRFPVIETMPYASVEYYNFADREQVPPATALYFGVNVRPTARVVLKAQYTLGLFSEPGTVGLGRDNIAFFESQVAWSF